MPTFENRGKRLRDQRRAVLRPSSYGPIAERARQRRICERHANDPRCGF